MVVEELVARWVHDRGGASQARVNRHDRILLQKVYVYTASLDLLKSLIRVVLLFVLSYFLGITGSPW